MQAVVKGEEAGFSMFGQKECLGFACVGAGIFERVEALRAVGKVGAFVAAVEGFFGAAFDVRADAAFADRCIGAAVVVGSAGAAPLLEEAVIAGEAAVV